MRIFVIIKFLTAIFSKSRQRMERRSLYRVAFHATFSPSLNVYLLTVTKRAIIYTFYTTKILFCVLGSVHCDLESRSNLTRIRSSTGLEIIPSILSLTRIFFYNDGNNNKGKIFFFFFPLSRAVIFFRLNFIPLQKCLRLKVDSVKNLILTLIVILSLCLL